MRSKIPWTDKVWEPVLHPERLDEPLHWRKPRHVFLPSMGDLFHQDVPDDFICQVFAVMDIVRRHTFQVLTKQAERMHKFVNLWTYQRRGTVHAPLPNVWLGVSAEDQPWADKRVTELLATPAAVRFVSFEPLLSAIDAWFWLEPYRDDGWMAPLAPRKEALDWVIVGGESGGSEDRRLVQRCNSPCHRYDCDGCPDCENTGWCPKPEALGWVRSLRDQCVAASVPFFFKGWGGPTQKFGGRLLDGREWNEMPGQELGQ